MRFFASLNRLLIAVVSLACLSTPSFAAFESKPGVCETSTTTGTGTLNLSGTAAQGGYITFVARYTSGATVAYQLSTGTGASRKIEVGTGVFTDGAPDTLTRATVDMTTDVPGGGTPLTLPAGTATICTGPTPTWFQLGGGNSSWSPNSDGTVDLGTTVLGWNNVFLDTGAVLNFENGDVTLTHASNLLTFAGGDVVVDDANGFVLGHTGQISIFEFISTPEFQELGTGDADTTVGVARFDPGTSPPRILLAKSRGATIGTQGLVANNDYLGCYMWQGSDGVAFLRAGELCYRVDGTTGVNDMPSRLTIATTADGAAGPTERWAFDSAGHFKPLADAVSDIGTTALGINNLFFDTGAVINFENGDVTITHAVDTLTVAGATSVSVGTATTFTSGSHELGAATDTTISRLSAGIAQVEGLTIPRPADRQTFTASGTWTKPTVNPGQITHIQCIGAGASGGVRLTTGSASGGGGGSFNERWIATSSLAATETVTINAAGTAVASSNATGVAGGNSTFGTWVTGYGGGAGNSAAAATAVFGGNGGTFNSVGALGTTTTPPVSHVGMFSGHYGNGEPNGTQGGAGGLFSGGGGTANVGNAALGGGDSVYGGAGGGSVASGGTAAGGTSLWGGNGGAGGSAGAAVAGTAPGGGGGAGRNGQASAAGAKGQCIADTF